MVRILKKIILTCIAAAVMTSVALPAYAASVNVGYELKSTENYYITSGDAADGNLLSEYLALVYSGFTIMGDSYIQNKTGAALLAAEIITNAASGKNPDESKTAELKGLQKEDGSFGSFEETCLSMIALKATKTIFSSEKAVSFIISQQDEEGLFSASGNANNDIENTALALTVLTPYTGASDVFSSVKKAVEKLNSLQNADGSYADGSSVTLSKVISALEDIGENTNSDLWKKMPELLITYKNENGSYRRFVSDESSDPEATAEALCALHALASGSSPTKKLMEEGKLSSFEVKDILPFLIFYIVLVIASIAFWIYILTKKKNERTLDDAKKAYELN